ncbi:hypothetical protein MGN70_007204 [Eutypa lata]|uniref:Putative isoflavone reductase family protein n=1 Tax=Eutypa lata (strain UCR-EL1) TaxID=1287681 RepID=M7TBK8_EUTLA|nr:putative isoflavone reductase family protein [Eutypa lata UCREL1]KAI1250152.1 hypothetical protein MGN70_007204 [Eutypa lata]
MTTSTPSKILLVGATGNIGKYITNAILSSNPPIAQKVSIFTSPATASNPSKQALLSSWKSQGLTVIKGDLRNADHVAKAYEGIDTVVSAVGRDGLLEQIELLKLAEASSSVKWFFPSEYGTDIEYDASSADEKPHQNKLTVRRFIRENIKKLKITYVVTGPYIDMFFRLMPGAESPGGFDWSSKKAVVVGSGNEKVGFTSMPDVGKFVAAALRHPEVSQGKALKVQSFVVSPNAILNEFEKQTGTTWTVEHTPIEKLRKEEKERWESKSPSATLYTLRRIWGEGKTLYEKTDNESLGLRDEDLERLSTVVGRAVKGEGF